MTQIMQIANPMWYSDTFVFKTHKDLGTVYIKVNGKVFLTICGLGDFAKQLKS